MNGTPTSVTMSVGALGGGGIIDFINWILSLKGIPSMPPGAGTGLLTILAAGYHIISLGFGKKIAAAGPSIAALCLISGMSFGIAACSSTVDQAVTDKAQADAAIAAPATQTGIALACAGFQIADLGFKEIAVPALGIDAGGQDIEAQAIAMIGKVCTPPYPQSTNDVLKMIADATALLLQAKSAVHATAISAPGSQ